MANIRVKQALDRIGRDMRRVREFIQYHHGVPHEDAMRIDTEATAICVEAATVAAMARISMGSRRISESARAYGVQRLVKRVRKALGFTHP